ncbi:MAG: substrate-binding domain-containing protein [Mobilicoccus sp.]|nr:substrate-binding domain-containing protein [Mobilicoccus sp.]
MTSRLRAGAALAAVTALALAACGGEDGAAASAGPDTILVSGSSTVAPITRLVASEGRFDVAVEAEGTINGFERFCAGETAINNASTPIPGEGQPDNFIEKCDSNGVEYVELPIGLDTLSIVRNEQASFLDDITTEELRTIWAADSSVSTWNEVRSDWPEEPLTLYGRDHGSGTYASFSYALTEDADGLRDDYEATDDLRLLSSWIAEDAGGLGFMGVGNYLATPETDRNRLSTVSVDGAAPSLANAQDGSYPITRPLFLYVAKDALEETEQVKEFVNYYLDHASSILPRTYFYPLEQGMYPQVRERLDAETTGTEYDGNPFPTSPKL